MFAGRGAVRKRGDVRAGGEPCERGLYPDAERQREKSPFGAGHASPWKYDCAGKRDDDAYRRRPRRLAGFEVVEENDQRAVPYEEAGVHHGTGEKSPARDCREARGEVEETAVGLGF